MCFVSSIDNSNDPTQSSDLNGNSNVVGIKSEYRCGEFVLGSAWIDEGMHDAVNFPLFLFLPEMLLRDNP